MWTLGDTKGKTDRGSGETVRKVVAKVATGHSARPGPTRTTKKLPIHDSRLLIAHL